MVFLQVMGIVFCIIVGGCVLVGISILLDHEICRRDRIDSHLKRMDDLENLYRFVKGDLQGTHSRVDELEVELIKIKDKRGA